MIIINKATTMMRRRKRVPTYYSIGSRQEFIRCVEFGGQVRGF